MKSPLIRIALAAFFAAASSQSLMAEENHQHDAKPPASQAKVKPYTLETCVVSDDKLGEMGKPVVFNYNGQEIKLCCKACRKTFDKDPAKYIKKLDSKK